MKKIGLIENLWSIFVVDENVPFEDMEFIIEDVGTSVIFRQGLSFQEVLDFLYKEIQDQFLC